MTITRGVVNVVFTGAPSIWGVGGIVLVSALLVLPTPAATGTWAFAVPSLTGFADQIIGTIGVVGTATGAVPAKLSAGVITPVGTLPEPGNNGRVSITGMVS
jgi:hypothetical protein